MKDMGRSRKQNRHRAKERNRRKDKSGKKKSYRGQVEVDVQRGKDRRGG